MLLLMLIGFIVGCVTSGKDILGTDKVKASTAFSFFTALAWAFDAWLSRNDKMDNVGDEQNQNPFGRQQTQFNHDQFGYNM